MPANATIPDEYGVDPAQCQPQLVAGETVIGYMITQFEGSARQTRNFDEAFHETRFRQFLYVLIHLLSSNTHEASRERGSYRLSERLTEQAFGHILHSFSPIATKRAGQALADLRNRRDQMEKQVKREEQEKSDKMRKELADNNATLVRALQEGLTDCVLSNFRYLL